MKCDIKELQNEEKKSDTTNNKEPFYKESLKDVIKVCIPTIIAIIIEIFFDIFKRHGYIDKIYR